MAIKCYVTSPKMVHTNFYDFGRINPEPLVAHKQTINRYLNLEVGQGHETKNLESVNTVGVAHFW